MKEKKEQRGFIKRDIIVVIVTLLAVAAVWGAKTFFLKTDCLDRKFNIR